MENQLRVAAYCRVSTDRDDQANSLISQRKYFTEYITHKENWILNDIYYDEGISGTQTKKRAGFNAMITAACNGGIDLILTKEVCRFARNTIDTLFYTRKLKDMGIGVIFTIDNIDTRESDGELRLTIMASIAQEESRKTSERVKWGQKRRMEQGIVFGRDLLGYTVQKGILTINESEVPIIRAIFHKYANEGKGTHTIARELEEEGIPPKRGTHWSNAVILKILKNEKYVGDLCQKKTYTPNYLTHVKKYNQGNEEKVYISNHHTPIIDRGLWNRTQEELLRRSLKEKNTTKHSNRYWCSGKLYCGSCGKHYGIRIKHLANNTLYRAWHCNERSKCNNTSINERILLSCMQYCINLLPINQTELKKELIQEIKSMQAFPNKESDLRHIQKKIDAINQKKRNAINLTLEGLITKDELKEQLIWYEKQLTQYNKTSETLQQPNTLVQCVTALDRIMTYDESNTALYGEILDKAVIYADKTVEIHLKGIPFALKLTAHSHGKGNSYTTKILNVEII